MGLAIVVRGQDGIELRKRAIEAIFQAIPPHEELADGERNGSEEGLSWSCTALDGFPLGTGPFARGGEERGNGHPPDPPLGPVRGPISGR